MALGDRIGDTYLCFTLDTRGRGWSGPYGTSWSGDKWKCRLCGYVIETWVYPELDQAKMAEHFENGHSTCPDCGKGLPLRKDGTPRIHNYRNCPGRNTRADEIAKEWRGQYDEEITDELREVRLDIEETRAHETRSQ